MSQGWQNAELSRWVRAVLLGIVLVAGMVALRLGPQEPAYEGHPLSYWAAELKSSHPMQSKKAVQVLREIGPQAIPFLLRKARSENSPLKRFYREAWFRLPDGVRGYLHQPQSEDDIIDGISHALHQLGPPAGPALMKAMEDKNRTVRLAAAGSFPFGDDPRAEVAWLVKMLQTPDYEPQQGAAVILGTMGTNARPAIPALLKVMQHDEIDYVRETAARSLAGVVGPETASVALGLKKCLSDRLASVRLWSAIALWRINRDPRAITVLMADLKTASGEDGTCHAAIRVLGEAGALAKPAVPEIRAIMLQYDPERALPEGAGALIQTAREALRLIDPETDPVEMLVP
jgi:HEAT repeat protein